MSQYSSKWLQVSEPFPHVLHIELARTPVNAFCREFWIASGKLFDALTEDGYDVRAAVVSSSFPNVFSAGLDLSEAAALGSKTVLDNARTSLQKRKMILSFQSALGAPERAPFPVIAAVHGDVIGLGVDLIAVCDIRYAASNTSFAIKEVGIGLAPGIGSLAFLPKITGNHSLVRELTYTARPFSAADAERLGLVSKVVQGGRDEVVKEALGLAALPTLLSNSFPVSTHSSSSQDARLASEPDDGAVTASDSISSMKSSVKASYTLIPALTLLLPLLMISWGPP
ncbi:ClpP/crotonase-like domain-containing protein [Flammula alnicola]|nr:ClpP/crotonase-like domain-containing protein [Flammula alnicola]